MSLLPFDDDPGSPPRDREEPQRGKPASPPAAPSVARPSVSSAPSVAASSVARPAALTVSELSARLRGVIEESFADIWVCGEISNGKRWNSGHYYFTLKDAASQIKAVVFRSALRYLKFKPEDGLSVTVRGRISLYEPKGEYQLVCEYLEPQGLGALQLAFEQLKKKLAAEGLFADGRKRPLPALPRRIGIVTSIDGAALRDIVRVLRRRYPNAHLVVAPARVQGEGAAPEIVRALRLIARIDHVDVVIVGRGGGALEDLWAFNEEMVARAIAACPIPVISAVGHETDFTIADFAADLRAPTPSAAAELVVRQKDEFSAHIRRLAQRLRGAVSGRLGRYESRLHALSARSGLAGFPGRLAWRARHVSELSGDLRHALRDGVVRRQRRLEGLQRALGQFDPRHRLARVRAALLVQDGRLHAAAARRLHLGQGRFREAASRLEGLSPLAVLGRGYAVCWDGERTRIVRDPGTLRPGDAIRVTLERGELRARVTDS
jgi:exodeoxyribonuclease VII large subunit